MHDTGRVRRGRALDLQGRLRRRRPASAGEGRREGRVAQAPGRLAAGAAGPAGVRETLKADLFEDDVFVFTPQGRGEVAAVGLHSARLRLRGAHRRRPSLRRREGQRQDRAAALRAAVGRHRRGAHLEAGARPVARLARAGARPRARSRRSAPGSSASGARTPSARGREILAENLKRQGLPPQKIAGSPMLADVIREMGFRKADDFYIALGQAKISPKVVTNKLMQRLKQGESAVEPQGAADLLEREEAHQAVGTSSALRHQGRRRRRRAAAHGQVLPAGAGRRDRRLHLAGQGHHHPPRGLPQRRGADALPERFTKVSWDGGAETSFRVELAGRRLRPHRAARGPLAHVRGVGDQHPRGALHGRRPDGEEPLRGGGGGHPVAEAVHPAPAQHRVGVRRLPRHADG